MNLAECGPELFESLLNSVSQKIGALKQLP